MRQISTVIEIGTSKVVSIISEAGQYDEPHILGNASVPYAGYKNRTWVDRKAVAPAIIKALHEAEHKAGHRGKMVHVGIPADFVTVVCAKASLELKDHQSVTEDDVNQLFAVSRSHLNIPKEYKMLHRCPVSFLLDGARRTMDPVGRRAARVSAVISYVLAERWFLTGMENILNRYGYEVSTYIAASYAEALQFIPEDKRDSGAVMLDIGATSSTLMLIRGDGLLMHRVLPFGGANVTNDLAKVFSVSTQMAEELKKRAIFGLSLGEDDFYEVCDRNTYRFVRYPATEVQEVIEARINEILEQVLAILEKDGGRLQPYVPVYVTGGTAAMRGIREFIQKQLERNTAVVQVQSTCFNHPAYSSALAVMELAMEAETDDEPGFFESIKNFFGI